MSCCCHEAFEAFATKLYTYIRNAILSVPALSQLPLFSSSSASSLFLLEKGNAKREGEVRRKEWGGIGEGQAAWAAPTTTTTRPPLACPGRRRGMKEAVHEATDTGQARNGRCQPRPCAKRAEKRERMRWGAEAKKCLKEWALVFVLNACLSCSSSHRFAGYLHGTSVLFQSISEIHREECFSLPACLSLPF